MSHSTTPSITPDPDPTGPTHSTTPPKDLCEDPAHGTTATMSSDNKSMDITDIVTTAPKTKVRFTSTDIRYISNPTVKKDAMSILMEGARLAASRRTVTSKTNIETGWYHQTQPHS